MTLIPLKDIPRSARTTESAARKRYPTRAAALEAAPHRLVAAPGCHSRPYFDPPVVGWVLTREAALAYESQVTRMPDGAAHRRARAELDAS